MNKETSGKFYLRFVVSNLLACFFFAVAIFSVESSIAATSIVESPAGQMQGVNSNGIHSFRGIRYALAPVDDLRWLAPRPVQQSEKPVDATEFGNACLQPVRPGSPAVDMSEDCLMLNVWTPEPDGRKRPVMVWIHGGGFRAGSGNIPGETFADLGVVLVSLNYRLGPLGFFSHEALSDQPANMGVLDMIAALHWIQVNIESFGGDPGNVTIFGVSAGGAAVNLLLTNDNARGLVHRAIAQSGYGTWPLPRSAGAPIPAPRDVYMGKAEQAEKISSELVARIGGPPQTKDMLYQLDGLALVNALVGFQVPIVDGISVLEEPGIRFLRGDQFSVPYMSGGNSFEGSVMPGSGISSENYYRTIAKKTDEARQLYGEDKDDVWLQRMFGDNRYLLSARLLADNMRHTVSKAWLYYTDFVAEKDKPDAPGTAHGMDGYFVFAGHLDKNPSIQALSRRMQRYWVNFSRTGNPNGKGLLTWPAYDRTSDRWLVFSDTDFVQTGVIRQKLDFLESLYLKRIAPAIAESEGGSADSGSLVPPSR